MKRFFILVLLFGFIPVIALGQDIHFSQYNWAPLKLNPANTGSFKGDHRVVLNYKNQWSSIADPYETVGISYDAGLMKKKLQSGFLGIGVDFFRDAAGATNFTQTIGNLSLSYHLQVNRKNMFTAGIMGGFAQQSIDMSKFEWDSQYNSDAQGFDPGLSSNETMNFENQTYGDVSFGVQWSYFSREAFIKSNDAVNVNLGAAIYHVNQPKLSFYDITNEKLYSKLVIHGNAFLGIPSTNIGVMPSLVYFNQGPSNEVIIGSMFRYGLHSASKYTSFENEKAFSIGGHYRLQDAFIAEVQMEFANFAVGFSYDFNTSSLSKATNGRGGMEISLRYCAFGNKSRSLY